MIKAIVWTLIGFIIGVTLGPYLDFSGLTKIKLENLDWKKLPQLIKIKEKQPEAEKKTVTKVIDGDTMVVEGGQEVRLLAIDADEKGEPCYDEAKNRLTELVLGKKVTLETDSRKVDQYGRLLRFVEVEDMNVNLVLLKEGVVAARFFAGDDFNKSPYVEAENFAKENGIGCKWRSVE